MDNSFKKKLFDHESEPLDNSWATLSASLDSLEQEERTPKKKSNTLIYWSIAASVSLLLSCMAVFWMLGKGEEQVAIIPIQPIEKQKAVSNKIEKSVSIPSNEEFFQKTKHPKNVELAQVERPKPIQKQTSAHKEEFLLPDSSKIYLNRNSQVSYSDNFAQDRVIHIQNGEVFFEVKHLHGQPFVVYANLSKTEVIGTSFMIRSYKDENKDELHVSTGKVAFSSLENPADKIVLTKGLKAEIAESIRTESSPIVDVNFNAWKNEKIVFNNTKLDEVSRTLEKYYAVSLQLNNPEILNCRFTGTFEKSGINEILKILAVSFNLSYDKQEGKYIISGKGCK